MNRTVVLLPTLLLATLFRVPVAGSQTNPASSAEQETIRQIVELERQSKEAAIQRNSAFTDRTLADDYLAVSPLGQIFTKSDSLTARRSRQLSYDSIEVSEMTVRIYGSTAIVTARAAVKGKDLGEDFSGPYRYTRVWVKRNGHWLTVSYQATVTQ